MNFPGYAGDVSNPTDSDPSAFATGEELPPSIEASEPEAAAPQAGSPQQAPPQPDTDSHVAAATESKARAAFARYKVMAYVTGAFLLLLTFEMVAKYLFNGGESVLGAWVAIVHGWIYVIYLITVFQVWSFMRWDLGRMAVLVAGGLVPLLSFVVELKAEKWFRDDLPARIDHAVRLARAGA